MGQCEIARGKGEEEEFQVKHIGLRWRSKIRDDWAMNDYTDTLGPSSILLIYYVNEARR
jgi:hypothetical protein